MSKAHSPKPHFLVRHALTRVALALGGGGVVAAIVGTRASLPVTAMAGWDVAGFVLLSIAWTSIWSCDAAKTAHRAAADDPGARTVNVLVLLASTVSLGAATYLTRFAKSIAPFETTALVCLCLATVALSWSLTHTAFTLRYAHLYYRDDDEGVGGIDLPGGGAPAFFDFAYFAFTVGMCFQVSDATITSPQIRRAVLVHAVMSFVYSTVIVAFTLNLVFGLVG